MIHHPVIRHLLILGTRTAIIGVWIDADATTRSENACNLDILRIHKAYEVLHNLIDAILVEVAMITEREKIELEALALHHTLVREV
jgi:hypothetical protein